MDTWIDLQSRDYDRLAVWPLSAAVYDSRPSADQSPAHGFHVHAYQGDRRVVHGNFDRVVIDGEAFGSASE